MKHFILFLSLVTIMSCSQESEKNKTSTAENADSLRAKFIAGWNNKDSAAIMNTIADNAIVMNDSMIHKGNSAIADYWISGGVKVLSNIQTTSVINYSDNNIVYDGGTYTLDLTPPGGPVLKEKGNYSLVWHKQEAEVWKLTLIHIEDVTRMPDIK